MRKGWDVYFYLENEDVLRKVTLWSRPVPTIYIPAIPEVIIFPDDTGSVLGEDPPKCDVWKVDGVHDDGLLVYCLACSADGK